MMIAYREGNKRHIYSNISSYEENQFTTLRIQINKKANNLQSSSRKNLNVTIFMHSQLIRTSFLIRWIEFKQPYIGAILMNSKMNYS